MPESIRELDEKLPILATINFEFKILNKSFAKRRLVLEGRESIYTCHL